MLPAFFNGCSTARKLLSFTSLRSTCIVPLKLFFVLLQSNSIGSTFPPITGGLPPASANMLMSSASAPPTVSVYWVRGTLTLGVSMSISRSYCFQSLHGSAPSIISSAIFRMDRVFGTATVSLRAIPPM